MGIVGTANAGGSMSIMKMAQLMSDVTHEVDRENMERGGYPILEHTVGTDTGLNPSETISRCKGHDDECCRPVPV